MNNPDIKFPSGFNAYVCIGDSIECESGPFIITATIEYDSHTGAPWLEHDDHGPVSEWTTRAKRPGELVLHSDGPHRRYYDFAQACQIARRDGWNTPPYDTIETPRQRASRAALADFKALRAWYNDEWFWCGIVVTVTHTESGLELASDSLWGIDANYPGSDNSHLLEVANEQAESALSQARNRAKELATELNGVE